MFMNIARLLHIAKQYSPVDDVVHDFQHIVRVLQNALKINEQERGDLTILIPAVLLHDIGRKDETPDKHHAIIGSEMAESILTEEGFNTQQIDAIRHAIEAHSFSLGLRAQTLEAKILSDADKIDALGPIGLARLFAFAGHFGIPLYGFGPAERRRDAVSHFYKKFPKIVAERMYTETGKRMLTEKFRYTEAFIKQLEEEVSHCSEAAVEAQLADLIEKELNPVI